MIHRATRLSAPRRGNETISAVRPRRHLMRQTTYKVVIPDDQNLGHDSATFDHESEARTYARAAAQGGRGALVLKIETEILALYPPETSEDM